MKRMAFVLVVATLALGCSDNDYRSNSQATPPSGPSGGSADFTAFVVSQYNATATTETAVPVPVDTTNFTFADDTNPDAFNTVIANAP